MLTIKYAYLVWLNQTNNELEIDNIVILKAHSNPHYTYTHSEKITINTRLSNK